MRTSRYFLATLKETPSDAEIISHQLMLRAGLIRRLAAGIYNWLPLGLKVLGKVEDIVRDEMNKAGALELLMPGVLPAELWRESGRWDKYGEELLRFRDRHERDFCLGPTHEEVITQIVRGELRSYRQLPLNLYQFQWKFRDEIRPRFGVMRGREFLMKDAYSFDVDERGMHESYEIMRTAYHAIFKRLQLEASAVEADSGAIGGTYSHEFHVLADSGEDAIGICQSCGYAANVEKLAVAPERSDGEASPQEAVALVDTPGVHTISELCDALGVEPSVTIKTLVVRGSDGPVALIVRGDHELNAVKCEKIDAVNRPLEFANAAEIAAATGAEPGSVGPKDLNIPIIVDHAAASVSNFVCGANQNDKHYKGVNWARDVGAYDVADIRMATAADPCAQVLDSGNACGGTVSIRRGIEVGHIFQLGQEYSRPMNASVLDASGKPATLFMGCYGIGVSRIVAAAIEQNHDDKGIIWPSAIAPFDVCVVPIAMAKSTRVQQAASRVYEALRAAGYDVLLDDRDERPGVLFSDMELIGIPHRLVIGERGLDKGIIEYRNRCQDAQQDLNIEEDIVAQLAALMN